MEHAALKGQLETTLPDPDQVQPSQRVGALQEQTYLLGRLSELGDVRANTVMQVMTAQAILRLMAPTTVLDVAHDLTTQFLCDSGDMWTPAVEERTKRFVEEARQDLGSDLQLPSKLR